MATRATGRLLACYLIIVFNSEIMYCGPTILSSGNSKIFFNCGDIQNLTNVFQLKRDVFQPPVVTSAGLWNPTVVP